MCAVKRFKNSNTKLDHGERFSLSIYVYWLINDKELTTKFSVGETKDTLTRRLFADMSLGNVIAHLAFMRRRFPATGQSVVISTIAQADAVEKNLNNINPFMLNAL